MVWLAVDKDGTEVIFEDAPVRGKNDVWQAQMFSASVVLPKGTIMRLTGEKLTWKDKPITYSGVH